MDIKLFRNLPDELVKKIIIFASPIHPTAKIISELQLAKKNKRELCRLYRQETTFRFLQMRELYGISQVPVFDGFFFIGRIPPVFII